MNIFVSITTSFRVLLLALSAALLSQAQSRHIALSSPHFPASLHRAGASSADSSQSDNRLCDGQHLYNILDTQTQNYWTLFLSGITSLLRINTSAIEQEFYFTGIHREKETDACVYM